ncbi:MAG: nicotinate (nicotinamide) nucleotide adenylyltransferase [Peptostreptococcaceae bacterium]|nr:nicotinate (nicotinamide) nucleotide adenylyltransferase [Peptostreptococcaceae bacterium]
MKIGILGGTFDPVHFGHLTIAKQAIEELGLDKLIVVPANLQPFKLDVSVTIGKHRIEMLKLAFEGVEKVTVSDYELTQNEVSYTINTLNAFKKEYFDSEIWFLLGTDSFLKIEIWKNAKDLLSQFNLIVGARPGYKQIELEKQIKHLQNTYGTTICMLKNKRLDISSTDIKKEINQGNPIKEFVPLAVERYITEYALYK